MMANQPRLKAQNVLADQTILLTGSLTDCLYPLRRLVVWDKKNQKQVVFLTNHHKLTASIVANIYKDRWEIELFFTALKQNLKIKIFVAPAATPWNPDLGSLDRPALAQVASSSFPGRMVIVQPDRHAAPKFFHIQGTARLALSLLSHPALHA
ncbi:hypothetical protein DFAR_670018 [Desulfarculales bacterium]